MYTAAGFYSSFQGRKEPSAGLRCAENLELRLHSIAAQSKICDYILLPLQCLEAASGLKCFRKSRMNSKWSIQVVEDITIYIENAAFLFFCRFTKRPDGHYQFTRYFLSWPCIMINCWGLKRRAHSFKLPNKYQWHQVGYCCNCYASYMQNFTRGKSICCCIFFTEVYIQASRREFKDFQDPSTCQIKQ